MAMARTDGEWHPEVQLPSHQPTHLDSRAAWDAETPVPADVHQHVLAELDRIGFADPSRQDDPAPE
jgi:hypothetical protein